MNLLLASMNYGMSTADVLMLLVSENPSISAIYTFKYKHPSLLQQRLELTSEEKIIIDKAIALRKSSQLPFWEALMLSCFDEKADYSRLLEEATFHQTHNDSLIRITREDVLTGRLDKMINSLPPGHHLSFSSNIEFEKAGMKLLPLLDFHCPETTLNDQLVSEVCHQLYRHVVIVFSSGESYHALGLESLDNDGFRDFLTRSLLFSPIVDARYVAHQLLEGRCALRLSDSANKPERPKLKFIFTPSKKNKGK